MTFPEKRILVVDDVTTFCQEMRRQLRDTCGDVAICGSPLRAVRLLRKEKFNLLITTLVMRELGGFDLIRRIRGQGGDLPILMITAHGSPATAIEATRLGVHDYLERPVRPEELRARVAKIFGSRDPEHIASGGNRGHVESQDPAMQSVFEKVDIIARSESRILILGETGTGKELIANEIHRRSPRAEEPFVDVNCAAIPENLLESELFGHERGAFTGATDRRVGRFEEAGDGTLFLDEIGETSFSVQSKLLRVLQSGKFSRVGGQAVQQSRARVIAATNRDLQAEVDAGRFRADLFFRLNVITITLPPLRRRPVDVPALVDFFLLRFRGARPHPARFSDDAMRRLKSYGWPGNIRELEHVVEQMVVLHPEPEIEERHLPERILRETGGRTVPSDPAAWSGPFREAKSSFERSYLREALRRAQGNLAEAARLAELDRAQFYRLARRHGLTSGAN